MVEIAKGTSNYWLIESESGFPPAIFDAIHALNALCYFIHDLTTRCRPCIGLPMQNPRLPFCRHPQIK